MDNRDEILLTKQQSLLQKILFKIFSKIQYGCITLIDDNNGCFVFEGLLGAQEQKVELRIKDQRTYRQVFYNGSIGAAESYLAGYWEADNLTMLLEIIIKNQAIFAKIETPIAKMLNYFARMISVFKKNNISRAKKNILAHYDLGNKFFELFLDSSMMYSCALYEPQDISLESASYKKLDEICKKLELTSSDHLLEIGSGWGGLAIYAAQNYGCKVTTTTISNQQYDYVQQKINQLGLAQQITLLNQDYRRLTGQYDKLVSVEMIEAIGYKNYDNFFAVCSRLIKPNGLFLLQTITINDQSYERAKTEIDFIKKYIFPGGCLPSVKVIVDSVSRKTQMQLMHMRDIGQHYATTIEDWLANFKHHIQQIRQQGFSEQFIRMWEFYFCYCAAGFRQAYISDVHMLWRK